jgi:ribosomal protein L17
MTYYEWREAVLADLATSGIAEKALKAAYIRGETVAEAVTNMLIAIGNKATENERRAAKYRTNRGMR